MAVNDSTVPDTGPVVSAKQGKVYRAAMRAAREHGIGFAIGGAFGLGTYTGQWRDTKDLDIYVLPKDRHEVVAVFHDAGLADYYDRLPYDRRWIYRGHRGDIIVDAIWAMANQRAEVDERWLSAARPAHLFGEPVTVIPPEEMLWQKLYILQHERCDWPDALNIVSSLGNGLDWAHLLDRLKDDWPLLAGLLSLYRWMCPGRARALPEWLWERLRIAGAEDLPGAATDCRRAALLDSRPWLKITPRA